MRIISRPLFYPNVQTSPLASCPQQMLSSPELLNCDTQVLIPDVLGSVHGATFVRYALPPLCSHDPGELSLLPFKGKVSLCFGVLQYQLPILSLVPSNFPS